MRYAWLWADGILLALAVGELLLLRRAKRRAGRAERSAAPKAQFEERS